MDYGLAFAHPFVRRSPFPSDTFDSWPSSIRLFFCRMRDLTAAADALLTLGIAVGLFKAYAPLFAPRPTLLSWRLGRSLPIAVHPTSQQAKIHLVKLNVSNVSKKQIVAPHELVFYELPRRWLVYRWI